MAMMERPKDVIIVSAKRSGKGHRGWSKNNPYLEDRWVDFEIDVDPASLTSRILSVREQIAKEWATYDLDVLQAANAQILDSYLKMAKVERAKRDAQLVTTPPVVFERTAVDILNNSTEAFTGGGASSPFRKGNFDLLYNLVTQASIHRLLRQLGGGGGGGEEEAEQQQISFAWLRDFYTDRVQEYFDGDQKYGRADDFMDDLLSASPSVVYSDDGKAGLADPMRLAGTHCSNIYILHGRLLETRQRLRLETVFQLL